MLSVRCSEGICLKNRKQEAAARSPTSVLELKFVQGLIRCFAVIAAKAGIQKVLKFLDSGSR